MYIYIYTNVRMEVQGAVASKSPVPGLDMDR